MIPIFETSLQILGSVAVLSYFLGSIPFGLVMARLFKLGDLRKVGSGNIGATNVLRTGNRTAAALTLILDAGKGAIAVLVARFLLADDAAQVAAFSAFLGHLFPIWLIFRGGKGVATHIGTILALNPLVGIATCLTWLATAWLFRMSSLSALTAAALTPLWAWLLGYGEGVVLMILLGVLIYIRHIPNIARILAGTETRIGQKSDRKEQEK